MSFEHNSEIITEPKVTFTRLGRGVCVFTCDEKGVHAWRGLRRLEHLADVFLWQGGFSSALPLGVLLLAPLDILG